MRLCRARDAVFTGEIVTRTRRASVQTRQRGGRETRADGAIVYSVRSRPQLFVLPLQLSDQFLKLQHLQLCVGDFTVAIDVGHHLGAQHLCFHLVNSTLRGAESTACLLRVLVNSEGVSRFHPFQATTRTHSQTHASTHSLMLLLLLLLLG